MFTHPEIKKELYTEYSRLTKRYPLAHSYFKMQLARQFVKDLMSPYTHKIIMEVMRYPNER